MKNVRDTPQVSSLNPNNSQLSPSILEITLLFQVLAILRPIIAKLVSATGTKKMGSLVDVKLKPETKLCTPYTRDLNKITIRF